MVIALEEEGECSFGRVHSNLEILWFSCKPLPFLSVLLNLLDLEHVRKGSDSAHEGVLFRNCSLASCLPSTILILVE